MLSLVAQDWCQLCSRCLVSRAVALSPSWSSQVWDQTNLTMAFRSAWQNLAPYLAPGSHWQVATHAGPTSDFLGWLRARSACGALMAHCSSQSWCWAMPAWPPRLLPALRNPAPGLPVSSPTPTADGQSPTGGLCHQTTARLQPKTANTRRPSSGRGPGAEESAERGPAG